MELSQAIRNALEHQIFEHEPTQAALYLRDAVNEHGAEAVAGELVDAAAIALRRMVADTDEAFEQAELLDRLALDGTIAAESIGVVGQMLTVAASTAGGIRPPVGAILLDLGKERGLFGAWMALLTTIRVVAITLERTEADLTEEILGVLGVL
ncbi:MAG TPA: hypothetical protein VIL48_22410 [Acidimicrobiales bacterium]